MSILRVAAVVILGSLAVSACSAGSPAGSEPPSSDPSPSSPTTPSASPSDASPDPSAGDGSALIRVSITQALGPDATFTWLPLVLITSERTVLVPDPIPAIAPGPLVTTLSARSLDPKGWGDILDLIRGAGLLQGVDVDPGPDVAIELGGRSGLVGGQLGHLEVVVDGIRYDVSGDPAIADRCGATFCPAADPGTPEAFAEVWNRLTRLEGWLGGSLGVGRTYEPEAYAVLTGPPPTDATLPRVAPEPWPLPTPLAVLGSPLRGDVTRRCGIVSGADAAALRPALQAATQATVWTDPSVVGSRIGLTVRPMLPGDADPCTALTG
jgi:hypothetical protein